MEFKGDTRVELTLTMTVLIESDWNLKLSEPLTSSYWYTVLIESDWNLKEIYMVTTNRTGGY